MCGGCAPATGINSPPEGGVHDPPARFACAVPAAPRALPGRGLAPQTPRAAPPGAPSRTGPLLPRPPSRRVPGTGATVAGVDNRFAVVHARRLAPPPLPWIPVFKARQPGVGKPQALSTGGVSPCSGGGGQTPAPPAGRLSLLGGQRGCPRPKRATGQSASATRHPVPARRRNLRLCRFIRENDSCEFGKNPALARARARLLVFFS